MIYSIEYCHVYTSSGVDELAENSISALRDVLKDVKDTPYELAVMVDDYSPKDKTDFDYKAFIDYLNVHKVVPSLFIKESDLLGINRKILDRLPNGKLRQSYVNYILTKEQHPCSLFVASWYMLRLGLVTASNDDPDSVKMVQPADRLINILPAYFIDAENRAAKILRALGVPYSTTIMNIYLENKS